jgi:F-type H+-transporting ATPase subunit b
MNIAILAQGGGGLLETARVTGETFGFNVWIFLSQIISFTIVALLLRKFAYKPILTVLEERRQKIAEGLLNAEKIKQQLADAEKRYGEIMANANTAGAEDDRRRTRERFARSRAQAAGSSRSR